MDATTKTGRSMIDEAIDKAIELKKIKEIIDIFFVDKIVDYLIEKPVNLEIYKVPREGIILVATQDGEEFAAMEDSEFPQEVTNVSNWVDDLMHTVGSLNLRTERIHVDFPEKNASSWKYCISLK